MKQTRIEWIDVAKAFGIFWIVFGHYHSVPPVFKEYLYSFHIPLFFFLSGYVFNSKKHKTFSSHIKYRARTILQPYFIFSLLTYFIWLFFLRQFGTERYESINVIRPLIGTFYGVGSGKWLIHNSVLWFLPCLFVTEIFFVLIKKYTKHSWQVIFLLFLSGSLGIINSRINPIRIPWGGDISLYALVFYGSGHLIREYQSFFWDLKPYYKFFLALAGFSLALTFVFFFDHNVDFNTNKLGNIYYLYPIAYLGISTWIFFAQLILPLKPLLFIGQNTLIILLLHNNSVPIVRLVQEYLFHIPWNVANKSFLMTFLYTVSTMIVLTPIILIINNFFPFLIGKRRRNKFKT